MVQAITQDRRTRNRNVGEDRRRTSDRRKNSRRKGDTFKSEKDRAEFIELFGLMHRTLKIDAPNTRRIYCTREYRLGLITPNKVVQESLRYLFKEMWRIDLKFIGGKVRITGYQSER